MTTGQILIRSLRRDFRRASAQYGAGNRDMARFWIGGCAALYALATDLGAAGKVTKDELLDAAKIASRVRAIFEELDLGGADLNAVQSRAYPDSAAQALDEYMAICGL